MKAVILIITTLVLTTSSVFAAGNTGNTVEQNLPQIQALVKSCTVLPYEMKNDTRMEGALVSHCAAVKVLPVSKDHGATAEIKLNGHQYLATLIETEFSDGDFYDVEIRDMASDETFRLYNAPAYGDVLLGVLDGDTQGVNVSLMAE